MVGVNELVCRRIDDSIKNRKRNTKGNKFSILVSLTELYLFCLGEVKKHSQVNFPIDQEQILFKELKSILKSLESGFIKFDAEGYSYVRVALRDCEGKQDASFKEMLVKNLLSSYKSISTNIKSKIDLINEGSLNNLNSEGPLLDVWKGMLKNYEEKYLPKSNPDKHNIDYPVEVNEYFKVRRDVDSLYKVYFIIKSSDEILRTEKERKDERKLVLERLFFITGEYMKHTEETSNLSDDIRSYLRKEGIPLELLSEFRNLLAHHVVPIIDPDEKKVDELFRDSFRPIEKIAQSKIVQIENNFINDVVNKVSDQSLKEKLVIESGIEGIKGLITYIESIQKDFSTYDTKKSDNCNKFMKLPK